MYGIFRIFRKGEKVKYKKAEDLKEIGLDIIEKLKLIHIDINNVFFFRSYGSKTRRTIARCHSMSKVLQLALDRKAAYIIEVISERFDKLGEEEKIKTIIHELMHIPKSFGGGFRFHNYVCNKEVNKMYKKYLEKKKNYTTVNQPIA